MRCRILCIIVLLCAATLVAGCTRPAPDAAGSTTVPAPTYQGTLIPEGTSKTVSPQTVATTAAMILGTPDPAFIVDINMHEKAWPGNTLLVDNHDLSHPRILEVNQRGAIVWEYPLPAELKKYTNPGWDVELLPNGNILTVLPRNGVYEINRDKQVIWKYLDTKVSHDADRLANGNTLVVFGAYDTQNDAQVKEIDSSGKLVWSWYARNVFTGSNYSSINDEGWTHTNAVTRLDSGNTLISLRNFNVIAEVDKNGKLVRQIGDDLLEGQHDPQVLQNGNILLANHGRPHVAMELDTTGRVVWAFPINNSASIPVRDVNRLPNGNTLITEADRIVEVTPDKEVVWQFRMTSPPFTDRQSYASLGFYKAERIPA